MAKSMWTHTFLSRIIVPVEGNFNATSYYYILNKSVLPALCQQFVFVPGARPHHPTSVMDPTDTLAAKMRANLCSQAQHTEESLIPEEWRLL